MAERSVYLEGRNLGLIGANTALLILSGLLWFGPGKSALASEQAEVAELRERAEEWDRRIAASPPLRADELERWSLHYAHLASHGIASHQESHQLHELIEWLRNHDLHDLEVIPQNGKNVMRERDDEESSGSSAIRVPEFEGGPPSSLEQVPFRVRFRSSYESLASVLEELSDPQASAEIKSLEVRRNFPEVRVELRLALWTRWEGLH